MHFRQAAETPAGIYRVLKSMNCVSEITNYVRAMKQSAFYPFCPHPHFIPFVRIRILTLLSVRPSARPSVRPSVRPPVRPSARPSVRVSVRPSVRPRVRPRVRPSVRIRVLSQPFFYLRCDFFICVVTFFYLRCDFFICVVTIFLLAL